MSPSSKDWYFPIRATGTFWQPRFAGRADVIVTSNLRDFPTEILGPFEIDAQHPDEFVIHLLDLAPGTVADAARDHRDSLKNPPKTSEEYLNALEAQGLTETVAALRACWF